MPPPTARLLDWDGCRSARDLGGLVTAGGRRTRHGAVVRSDAVDRLSATGWAALYAGQIAMLLLTLVGVGVDEIATDYALSAPAPAVEDYLRERGTSAADAIGSTLASLDVEAHLGAHGLGAAELAALRRRLLDP